MGELGRGLGAECCGEVPRGCPGPAPPYAATRFSRTSPKIFTASSILLACAGGGGELLTANPSASSPNALHARQGAGRGKRIDHRHRSRREHTAPTSGKARRAARAGGRGATLLVSRREALLVYSARGQRGFAP